MARERRLVFGEVAELYDQARPSYPPELVNEVLRVAPVGRSTEVLEVGAGTGKATVLFAARGVRVLALEPSAEMAMLARRNCERYPGVRVVLSDFEDWETNGARVPLIYSGAAWHWVLPEARYARARTALIEGGVLAAFWNHPDWDRCSLRDELIDAYRLAPDLDGPMNPAASCGLWGYWGSEIAAATGFHQPEVRCYRWKHVYSTADYLMLLRTHSDHLLLADDRREALFAAIADVLSRHDAKLPLPYITRLCLARKS